MSLVISYSTDNINWVNMSTLANLPTSATTNTIDNLSITVEKVYLKFVVSVESTTGSNRDFQLDDIVVTYSAASSTVCATPTFSPAAGAVAYGTTVAITSATADATIYYTTNGDEPTTSSTPYTDPIAITAATTLKAIAVKGGLENSAVATANFTVVAATPTFSPAAGVYTSAQSVTISTSTDGATIYYTTDGSDPTTSSSSYTSAISVSSTTTIKAMAVKENYTNSSVASATYTFLDHAGTSEDPYSVADALAAIDAGFGVTNVYVSGIVSTVATSVSNGQMSYYISDDGSTTTQLEAYKGKGLSNNDFTTPDEVELYDHVTIYGSLTKYNTTYEFSSGNYLISQTHRLTNTITVTIDGATATNKEVDRSEGGDPTPVNLTGTASTEVSFVVDNENTTLPSANYSFDATNNQLTINGTTSGIIVLIATAPENVNYYAGNQIVTITVNGSKADAVINVQDESVAYGSTFTVDDSAIEGGTITVTSSNTAVATVSGLVITPVAVGTTTITVSTAEDATYKAGSETFTLTVTAPAGKTTIAQNFLKVTETANITDGEYLIVYETGNVAFNGGLETLDDVGNTVEVSITDDKIAASDAMKAATFIIDKTAGTLMSKSGKYIGVSSNNNGLSQTDDPDAYTNSFSIDEDNNAVITASFEASNMSLRYNKASNQTRFRYYKNAGQEAIQLYKLTAASFPVTLNGSGYATYCSEHPLDFSPSATVGYTAWQITDISGSTIEFGQVTGTVKGGTGLLLKGEKDETITLSSSASTTELSGNKLVGTTAPLYVADNEYYGLSGNEFKKVNAGTVPAGKALLPADDVPAEVKSFTFVFEGADGVRTVQTVSAREAEEIFDLSGRRLQQMQRGLNIVAGKKVMVK